MRRISALLLLASVGLGCEVGAPARVDAPPAGEGEIAFELIGPNQAALVVPVLINGQGPFDFVLDTGATLTCIERTVAQRLELPSARGAVGYGAGIGGQGRVELVRIDSLRVGEAAAHDLVGCVLDLGSLRAVGANVDGLLGLNVLREFHVSLDFRRNILRLEDPAVAPAAYPRPVE
jgi:predicted aspartyl protease